MTDSFPKLEIQNKWRGAQDSLWSFLKKKWNITGDVPMQLQKYEYKFRKKT